MAIDAEGCATGPDEPHAGTCATHYDCYPERVCFRWRSDGVRRCSAP